MNRIMGLVVVLLLSGTSLFAQQELVGKWLTQDKDAVVEIYQKENKFYGRVVQLMPATQKDGSPFLDVNNPEEHLRNRKILGMNTILDFEWNGEELENGKLYDPKSGNHYEGKIWVENNQLRLRGYVGFVFSTETWTKQN
ncbi:DUF2147 domain-containing protein [bacterium SCSIO 12741]|nr:DUF2147 domain-containing protein [bacterium SCSIO 12741]